MKKLFITHNPQPDYKYKRVWRGGDSKKYVMLDIKPGANCGYIVLGKKVKSAL